MLTFEEVRAIFERNIAEFPFHGSGEHKSKKRMLQSLRADSVPPIRDLDWMGASDEEIVDVYLYRDSTLKNMSQSDTKIYDEIIERRPELLYRNKSHELGSNKYSSRYYRELAWQMEAEGGLDEMKDNKIKKNGGKLN